jgi:hypothetical protein
LVHLYKKYSDNCPVADIGEGHEAGEDQHILDDLIEGDEHDEGDHNGDGHMEGDAYDDGHHKEVGRYHANQPRFEPRMITIDMMTKLRNGHERIHSN